MHTLCCPLEARRQMEKTNIGYKHPKKSGYAMFGTNKHKLHLDYPCQWIYKIIGTNQDEMQSAVTELIRDRPCKISFSRRNEMARYISLNVEVIVESESHRMDLYYALKAHPAIKVVL
jgi:putative lipoic acid-binding regulatory protein